MSRPNKKNPTHQKRNKKFSNRVGKKVPANKNKTKKSPGNGIQDHQALLRLLDPQERLPGPADTRITPSENDP